MKIGFLLHLVLLLQMLKIISIKFFFQYVLRSLLFTVLFFGSNAQAESIWDADVVGSNSRGVTSTRLTVRDETVFKLDIAQLRMWLDARNQISSQAGTYAKLLFSDKPELNASAGSANGVNVIKVSLQMLDMIGNDKDQCAALLGHEITHIVKEHGNEKAALNTFLSILGGLAAVAIDYRLQVKTGVNYGLGQDIAGLGSGLVESAFSRGEEREADEYGFELMTSAGYDPQGAVQLYTNLLNRSGDNHSFLSSHPASSERVANMQRLIAQYQATNHIRLASLKSTQTINPDRSAVTVTNSGLSGQVGVVLTIKSKYNYVILAGTTATPLPVGLKVNVLTANNEKLKARIARAVDGYYSAVIDDDIRTVIAGDRIEVDINKEIN
jgi:Zn-dependent protease with chaperone function